jgi:hypothetical protein
MPGSSRADWEGFFFLLLGMGFLSPSLFLAEIVISLVSSQVITDAV